MFLCSCGPPHDSGFTDLPCAGAAICRLIPCVQGGQTVRYLCTLFAPSASENRANHKRLRKFVTLTAENPTGVPTQLFSLLGKNFLKHCYVCGSAVESGTSCVPHLRTHRCEGFAIRPLETSKRLKF
eukprot:1960164-Amphidinium_carterae.2